jgi:inner membrane protein
MDPLTHSLTGLALSRAGLNRWSPYAGWILLFAANAPDIDIVALAGGSTEYLHYHRHITHALLAIPLLALGPLILVRLAARKPLGGKRAYAVSIAGVASHGLLDWTNTYGVRLFLPFSADWFHLDIVNLFDLWIWTALLFAALAPALARLVSSEIGAVPGSGRRVAIFALAFFACYGFLRYVSNRRAVAVLESRLYEDSAPLRAAALPGPWNPFRWTGLVETAGFYSLVEVDLRKEFDPTAGRVFYKPEPRAAEEEAWNAARGTEAFQVFLEFSRFPLRRFLPVDEPEGALRVEVNDLRFGAPPAPRFVAAAVVDQSGRVLRSWFVYAPGEDKPPRRAANIR